MTRPKGSKNKPKPNQPETMAEVVNEPIVETIDEPMIEATPERWKPAPDMGDIKPPVIEEVDCKNCSHKGAHHYGGESKWCNVTRCNCQAFR